MGDPQNDWTNRPQARIGGQGMAVVRIQTLGGVPILYDRQPATNYGKSGFRYRPRIDEDFAATADGVFSDMFRSLACAGVGDVTAILTGGIARAGTGPGYHHNNRAMDLDALVYSSGNIWVANTFPARPFEYLIIEGHLRKAFGTVLTYDYNPAHQDHIHFDNGDSVGFRRHSKSRTLFVQNALLYLFDLPISIDGVYGPETQGAERTARSELGIGGLGKTDNWRAFLQASIEEAQDRLAFNAADHAGL